MAFKYRATAGQLTTSNQDIYVAPSQYHSRITSILISNASSSQRTVSMDWYDNTDSTWHSMLSGTPIPANGIVQITDSIHLDKSDKIRALASASSSITVTITAEETYLPAGI